MLLCLLFSALLSSGQSVSVFNGFAFDSTYSLVALSSTFSNQQKDPQQFCFFVKDVDVLTDMQRQWVVTSKRPKISLEQNSIGLFLLKNGYLVSSQWLIYPEQGIIHYGDTWYDFDMKKFNKVQQSHPLRYRSQTFDFDRMLDLALFRDSLQRTSDFLFLFEPTVHKFAGYFNIVSAKSAEPNDDIFVMHDINKELQAQFPTEKFNLTMVVNDLFNLTNKDRVRVKVECEKTLFEKYKSDTRQKEAWTAYKFDTKVIFRN